MPEYQEMADGTVWPAPDALAPDSDHSVQWALRFDPKRLTKQQLLYAASILDAYDHIMLRTGHKQVAMARREFRPRVSVGKDET